MNYKTLAFLCLYFLSFFTVYGQFDLGREIKNNVPFRSLTLPNAIVNYYEGLIDNKHISFDDCFTPQAQKVIYDYLLQRHWEPTALDKNIADKMFGVNNYGISYQFYEPPILQVSVKRNNITVPFKLLNKYIKANGPLGVFKRKK